ncbi:tyrosine-protein kinase Srms [Pelomyxa schiedti]|nr:tyrosine-protein kinase Srms [Pelomyxa schiedti]
MQPPAFTATVHPSSKNTSTTSGDESGDNVSGGDGDGAVAKFMRLQAEAPSRVAAMIHTISDDIHAPILENVEITGRQLGHGGFAGVFLGHWTTYGNVIPIACKFFSEGTAEDFKNEVKVIFTLKDTSRGILENITQFFGICARDTSLVLVMENIQTTLPSYIASPDAKLDFVDILTQIAAGMDYICSKHVIHRDLCSKNILVLYGNDCKKTYKISDIRISFPYFSFCCGILNPPNTSDSQFFMMNTFHLREPERRGEWSYDVWSYGIAMWEIYSRMKNPFTGIRNDFQSLRDFWTPETKSLEQPPEMPDSIYLLCKSCWERKPINRITFGKIREVLQLTQQQNHTNITPQASGYNTDGAHMDVDPDCPTSCGSSCTITPLNTPPPAPLRPLPNYIP